MHGHGGGVWGGFSPFKLSEKKSKLSGVDFSEKTGIFLKFPHKVRLLKCF